MKTKKMKAVIAYEPENYKLEEKEVPTAGFEEVIIKVDACGICGSDMHAYHGSPMFWGGKEPWLKAPVTPGHEFFGTVVELGEGAAEKWNIKIGDRVIPDQIIPCNNCKFCNEGKYWMCEIHNLYGFQKGVAEGGMSEYMKLYRTSKIHKIPNSLSLEDAALIEPMGCAIHTVQRADIEFEDTVVVAGAGPLGLCMIQLIKLKTPKKLVVLDLNEKRLELAKKFGADVVINPAKEDAIKKVKEMTGGYGCDVYIEASGSPKAVEQGLEMCRKLARYISFSVFSEKATADWSIIGDRKELDVRGAHLSPYTYPIAIDFFEKGLVTSEGVVTDKFKLEEFEAAMVRMAEESSIKVLLIP